MDGLFEKFSLYDFFNLIVSGATFLGGLHFLGFAPLNFIKYNIGLPDNKLILLATIILLCYIIGAEFQGIELFIKHEKRTTVEGEMIRTFLNRNSNIIPNQEKLNTYRKEAKKFLKTRNIKVRNDEFSREQCEYFYAYCTYYIQIKGENKKTEKMRGIKGISALFTACFLTLFIIGILRNTFLLGQGKKIEELYVTGISTFAFLILACSSYYRMKIVIKNWIRMTLGTYEICTEVKEG